MVADPAAIFIAVWVMMRPVHQTAEIIPFVHAAKSNSIAYTQWHAPRQINVVRDQQ